MTIPKDLINQVRQGRAVLFLGAGATKGSHTSDGKEPPQGNELRDRIAAQFLTGDYTRELLSWVSELAAASANLFEVQDFIAEQFADLKPSEYHSLIPTFRWRGIATTNFDRLVEKTYGDSKNPVQTIVPFLSNADRVDEKLRSPSSLAFLKLHGCVTRTHDEKLPFILSLDQYATYKEGRSRLFQMIEEWGSENTIIFVGQKLQEPNLRQTLISLTQKIPSRPRYYLVKPDVDEVERGFWEAKKITVLSGTFEEFLKELDSNIPQNMRPLAATIETNHAIQVRFSVKTNPSIPLLEFLSNDFEFVYEGLRTDDGSPPRFYAGFGLGWYPILMDLDARRGLTDTLMKDIVLRPEGDRPSQVELYLIKAEAGAGKSVFLRRLAWESSREAGVLCLFSKGTAPINLSPLREIGELTGERIFLFVDNAADNLTLIRDILEFARSSKIRLTLVTSERVNEWNVHCEPLEEYLSEEYFLYYLSHKEIEVLVNLLTKHDSLGPNLSRKSFAEQVKEFEQKAGRQLLVALHEATHGEPYERILLDEYNSILPSQAQHLYLSVCVLNRLNVPVRAGLISRIHDVPFELFKEKFFRPLEHVVNVVKLPWGDFAYEARHPEIAQIVFDEVLTDPADRFNEYVRVIKGLNPLYSVDSEALRGMLRAKFIHDLFPSYEDAKAIYDVAGEMVGDDPHFFQQRANYERVRPNGNLILAQSLLEKARQLLPTDCTITHTLAEVLKKRAETTDKKLEKTRLRSEARSRLRSIPSSATTARYGVVTELKIFVDEIQDLLNDEASTDREIDEAVREAEKAFEIARQRYPGDSFVLSAESDFAKLLEDSERSFQALQRARDANPRDPFITGRLSSLLVKKGHLDKALIYIKEALDSNRGNKRLNFLYAELLRTGEMASPQDLAYYYNRAFTKWDSNYESQFWYARFAYESNNPEDVRESREVFKHLREVPILYKDRARVQDAIGGLAKPQKFSGTVSRMEAKHGFSAIDGTAKWIFFHESDVKVDWSRLTTGSRVIFGIGFTLRGPKAINLTFE